jgi:glycosyltransferase involved in cell wall biosynthesis
MNGNANVSQKLSLLTAYRGKYRQAHLKVQLLWLERIRKEQEFTDFEVVVVEGDAEENGRALASQYDWVQFRHIPMSNLFHKSLLLNCAAAIAKGEYLIPFDVDLLPADGVLQLHLKLALNSPYCLVSGFRVQLAESPSTEQPLLSSEALLAAMDIEDNSLLGPEDNPRALRKYLIDRQRFGVCPCYPKQLYDSLGGYDEDYIGRGPEDQDLIERACSSGLTLIRSYDLLYFHMPHMKSEGWDDPDLLAANRARFAQRRRDKWASINTQNQ